MAPSAEGEGREGSGTLGCHPLVTFMCGYSGFQAPRGGEGREGVGYAADTLLCELSFPLVVWTPAFVPPNLLMVERGAELCSSQNLVLPQTGHEILDKTVYSQNCI